MKRTKKTNLAVAPRELPKPKAPWLDNWLETPPDLDYGLSMHDQGDPLQCIDLTRDEFIQLKKHLAAMRGQKPLKRSA